MADHTPPTEQKLNQIEALANAATPGPWDTYQYGGDSLIEIAADLEDTGCGYRARRTVCRFDEEPLDNDPTHRDWTEEQDRAQVQADAAFIAHAREDVGALAAEVRRLRAELESERGHYKAGLRRADEHVNAMSEELKRYADGKETPVLWSVYNAMHLRATNAESVIATVRATHKPRTERHGSGCVQCGIVWPCPTYKALTVEEPAAVPAAVETGE